MRCASCDFENPEGMKFCGECAAPLKSLCSHCGFENPPGFKFCGACAAPLTGGQGGKRKTGQKGKRQPAHRGASRQPRDSTRDAAERRQLTVLFCDLVGSTALSEQLDPEELRDVVRAYQRTSAAVIERYEGHIAQYLGDGLLVYFGYPVAHEDDAAQAVRTGVDIVGAIHELPRPNPQLQQPLQVRIGIHTGHVVVGEMGGGAKREELALGETPNIAARLQGLAEPDTVVISGPTYRLVQGFFECQDLGSQALKGITTPLSLYRVVRESAAHSRFEVAVSTGLTPLVGREEELGLLQRRWTQAKEGAGQVVVLSGEPGIGKSRLVQELKEQVIMEGATRIEFRCSPYHQNSAFYPIIEHLQRLLQFEREEPPHAKLAKLQQTLSAYRFLRTDTLPLLAALLLLPQPEGAPPLTLSPQKQKQKTQEALVAWLVEEAERQAVYWAWEDVHWIDPSSLEVLTLLLEQVPTTRLLAVLTCRPEFIPPWRPRSHLTQLTLSRLGRQQVEAMVSHVVAQTLRPSTSSGRTESELREETPPVRAESVEARTALPTEMVQQIVAKTDGVPLFVEELTKSVAESVGATHTSPLQLAIPATLHDSLMARLDRLGPAKEVAQLGATLGREFSYELLHTVSSLDEAMLQQGLRRLVEAELLYQRGLVPQATYLYKHALIQDTAYQSLLKSKRQQLHQQIAQVLEERFPDTKETQPEMLAHHYTEARLVEQAIPYWQRAGQRAASRSANAEAISHLTMGLRLLKTLPDTPEHVQQELFLQIALGPVLMAAKGLAAPEVGKAYGRARELCQQLGETPQLFPVLRGLCMFYTSQGDHQIARQFAEQCLRVAQSTQDPALLTEAHYVLGNSLFYSGKFALAREHFEQSLARYDLQQHRSHALLYGQDTSVVCSIRAAWVLYHLGYADQARKLSKRALARAHELSHSHSLAYTHSSAAILHQGLREGQAAQEQAEAAITLSTEQGFPLWVAWGTLMRGWALAEQGRGEEGVSQIRRGIASFQTTGSKVSEPYLLGLLAEACEKAGQVEEGLNRLAEALAAVDKTGERFYEAVLYRLKGELLQSSVQSLASNVQKETEECFRKAIEVAQKQQAKSLELRATVSLARLWQSQGKTKEAHELLSAVYGWFTEGFDTKDLQEAKALLDELVL